MDTPHTTVENTKKKFKLQLLLCHAVAIASLLVLMKSVSVHDVEAHNVMVTITASLLWLSASVWWVVTKCRIWWNHA